MPQPSILCQKHIVFIKFTWITTSRLSTTRPPLAVHYHTPGVGGAADHEQRKLRGPGAPLNVSTLQLT